MEVGTRVRLVRDVERFPHFVAEGGRTGTVTQMDEDQIVVELDEPVDGAEEWNNEIHWYAGMFEGEDFKQVFRSEVKVVT